MRCLSLLLLALPPQDACARGRIVQETWTIEPKGSVARKGKEWTFRVEGTTNLPKGTVLRARIYALDEVVDPVNGGTTLDEEPFFYGDEAFQDAEVDGGRFAMDVHALRRRPYSLRYRARVVYDPDYQSEETKKAAGGAKFHKDVDFREGTDAVYSQELKAAAKELNGEFTIVKVLYDDLKLRFAEHRMCYDAAAWKKWLDPWMDRVQDLRARNDDRMMLWTVWIERQGKLRIEGFCMRLPDLATDCREVLEGKAEILDRMQLKMKAFLDYYEEAIEVVGLDVPLDLETIVPALQDYLKQVERLKSGGPKAEIRREGIRALLAIAGTFEKRRKGYYRVNRILALFTDLLRAADADAFRKVLEEHDREVREFRDYAGIK